MHIKCGEKTLRRPISICEISSEEGALKIVFEIRGEGTAWLAEQNVGDCLDILAPLGNGFPVPCENAEILLVGGGIGVPPLLQVCSYKNIKANAVLGFRNRQSIILKEEFEACCNNVFITTDDGSYGHCGYVTDKMPELLRLKKYSAIFTCGPTIMMKGVAKIAEEFGVECYASLEERMGCGIGACLVCACKVKKDSTEQILHVCKNGPVFNAKEVVW